jgi:hypothetical protein
VSVPLDSAGSLSFRGFFGTYEIELTTKGGNAHLYPVHVRKDEQNSWTFTVGNRP